MSPPKNRKGERFPTYGLEPNRLSPAYGPTRITAVDEQEARGFSDPAWNWRSFDRRDTSG